MNLAHLFSSTIIGLGFRYILTLSSLKGIEETNRIPVTLVTRSTLEVAIPEHAIPKLIMKSKNMLSQISELSGANVTLVEDRPDMTQKTIQISGTPDQTERAQSLLQGFILSTQEDAP